MSTQPFGRLTIDEFLDRLASRASTPGGGSVAALSGALAAALGHMVCALTIGKPEFAAAEERLRQVAHRLERAGQMLRRLMDEDAAAYGELSTALKLSKSNPERPLRVRQAATLAAQVPLETATLSHRVWCDLKRLSAMSNPNLKSDVQASTHVARAAIHGAAANVRANLPLMDEKAATVIEKQLEQLLEA